ncbi:uncharacterized protein [Montipora capricornis]|uniref:uncharacterized protein n=1 Tax=Montipora capricornis TaxID=246305 RepID=UPI0035F11CDA
MSGTAFHQEAQRQQRVLERKHQFLENLKLQTTMAVQEKKLKEERVLKENEKTGTREGTGSIYGAACSKTRTATRVGRVREAFWVPDVCQTTTGSTYYRQLIPPRPEALHQWRDLKNRIRHDYNLVPLPYKGEDIVKR